MSEHGIRVALRADASATIGLGHVKRCLSLASALRTTGAEVKLVTRNLGFETVALATASGIECHMLPVPSSAEPVADDVPYHAWSGVDWRRDAEECVDVLNDWRPHWVVVDHYAFDSRWHRLVSDRLDVRLAVIDDLADRSLAADVLIDHNLSGNHREKYRGRTSEGIKMLGGPRYALLSSAYASATPCELNEHVRSIGIFMGGVDSRNLSSLALIACRKHAGFTGPIEIAITRAFPHLETLTELSKRWPATALSSDLPDLVEFLKRHDLQVGAGGGAVWERCCIGVPTVALIAAPNQDASLPALAALGAVALVDPANSADEDVVGEAILELIGNPKRRRELGTRSRALVDGIGAKRVALQLANDALFVRPAVESDAETMYSWRNDVAIRRMSRNAAEIGWEQHLGWIRSVLLDAERYLLIGCVGRVEVGVIRFDLQSHQRAEVSLYLDPALHGLGLGRALLLAGEAWLLRQRPTMPAFVATVLSENSGSKRLFESCGYRLLGETWCKEAAPRPQTR